jgi:hypothetical protein
VPFLYVLSAILCNLGTLFYASFLFDFLGLV